jgi:hypothetical protein
MSEQKKTSAPLFAKENLTWMLIGGVIVALGFFLMSGGKSNDPQVFDTKEVYSFTRVTLAPIIIILGLVIEIYAIFKKAKPTTGI